MTFTLCTNAIQKSSKHKWSWNYKTSRVHKHFHHVQTLKTTSDIYNNYKYTVTSTAITSKCREKLLEEYKIAQVTITYATDASAFSISTTAP